MNIIFEVSSFNISLWHSTAANHLYQQSIKLNQNLSHYTVSLKISQQSSFVDTNYPRESSDWGLQFLINSEVYTRLGCWKRDIFLQDSALF